MVELCGFLYGRYLRVDQMLDICGKNISNAIMVRLTRLGMASQTLL